MSIGIKVPMGTHGLTIHTDITGWAMVCSCGWTNDSTYPAYIHPSIADREGRQVHAAHVRHMALVHDAQTHKNTNCGRSCIYLRVVPPTTEEE